MYINLSPLMFHEIDFDDENIAPEAVRDGFKYLVGAVHTFLFEQGRHFIKTGYQFDYDATEGRNWEYASHHFIFGAQYTLLWEEIRLRYALEQFSIVRTE